MVQSTFQHQPSYQLDKRIEEAFDQEISSNPSLSQPKSEPKPNKRSQTAAATQFGSVVKSPFKYQSFYQRAIIQH